MIIVKKPADATNVLEYSTIAGKKLVLGDDDLTVNLANRERDDKVHLDFCLDYMGGIVMGTGQGKVYVAEVDIPPRRYEEVDVDNPDYDPDDPNSQPTIKQRVALPFDIDLCTLTLWELED